MGVLLSGTLIGCSNDSAISLKDLLGGGHEKFLDNKFPRIGGEKFSYYILKKGNFHHQNFNGEKVFIFCQKENIIGFTIQIKGNDAVNSVLDELDKTYSNKRKIFENEFGTKYQWSAPNKNISLCFTKEYPELPEYTFYSEYLDGENLIIF